MNVGHPRFPSILFSVVLGLAILAVFLHEVTASPGWCETNERAAACLRNWTNAAGNLFTFIGAAVAVLYTAGQFKAAREQSASAQKQLALGWITTVETRYAATKRLNHLAAFAKNDLEGLREAALELIANKRKGQEEDDLISEYGVIWKLSSHSLSLERGRNEVELIERAMMATDEVYISALNLNAAYFAGVKATSELASYSKSIISIEDWINAKRYIYDDAVSRFRRSVDNSFALVDEQIKAALDQLDQARGDAERLLLNYREELAAMREVASLSPKTSSAEPGGGANLGG